MPKVNVKYSTHLSAQEAYDKVSDFLNNSEYLHQIDANYSCDFQPENLSGRAQGKMFSADLQVHPEGSGSHVEICVKIPLALSILSGKIKSTLETYLERSLIT